MKVIIVCLVGGGVWANMQIIFFLENQGLADDAGNLFVWNLRLADYVSATVLWKWCFVDWCPAGYACKVLFWTCCLANSAGNGCV